MYSKGQSVRFVPFIRRHNSVAMKNSCKIVSPDISGQRLFYRWPIHSIVYSVLIHPMIHKRFVHLVNDLNNLLCTCDIVPFTECWSHVCKRNTGFILLIRVIHTHTHTVFLEQNDLMANEQQVSEETTEQQIIFLYWKACLLSIYKKLIL